MHSSVIKRKKWLGVLKCTKNKKKQSRVPSLIPILKLLRDHFGAGIISGMSRKLRPKTLKKTSKTMTTKTKATEGVLSSV